MGVLALDAVDRGGSEQLKTTAFFKHVLDLLATVTTQNHGFPIAADDCQPTNSKM